MAMPRRELYKVSGFSRTVDFAVLESLGEEHWFAAVSTLRGNVDAKEVRLGLVVTRVGETGQQVLVESRGVLLHAAQVPPEVTRFGSGLRALRELARAAAAQLLGTPVTIIELIGYLNDDALSEIRDAVVLIYRVRLPASHPAPADMNWLAIDRLKDIPLDPMSSLVAPGLA